MQRTSAIMQLKNEKKVSKGSDVST